MILFVLFCFVSIQIFTLPSLLPIPSSSPIPPPSSPSLFERGQGTLPCGKSKALPPTSGPRELCIHIDEGPQKPEHAVKTSPRG